MPPMPLTSDTLQRGTWRSPHSPRSWRAAPMIGKIPYIPEGVSESPPPLVLMGSEPPGVDLPCSKKVTPSPDLQKPSDSSMIGGPEVKASYSMMWLKSLGPTPAMGKALAPDFLVASLKVRFFIWVRLTCSVASPAPRTYTGFLAQSLRGRRASVPPPRPRP